MSIRPQGSTGFVTRGICAIAFLWMLAIAATAHAADGLALVDRLGTTDRDELARVVAEVEAAPADTPDLDEALFAAARACEDTLADPARALALYDRLLRERPDARRSAAARTRAELLRTRIGSGAHRHAKEAAELATLVAEADRLAGEIVRQRATALANAEWPGAPEAQLWLAEWLRRNREYGEAQLAYAEVARRWPNSSHASVAIRGGAANAIDDHDWDLAEQLARQLPAVAEIDRVMREELLEAAALGRTKDRWFVVSAIVIALVGLGLLASFVDATRGQGKARWRALRPPIEVVYLLPVAAVLVGVALTTHELIAPAVLWLSIGGLGLAWLSGATLQTLRASGRAFHGRAIAHAVGCFVAVFALLYILLVRDDLLDMIIETVRFGPSG